MRCSSRGLSNNLAAKGLGLASSVSKLPKAPPPTPWISPSPPKLREVVSSSELVVKTLRAYPEQPIRLRVPALDAAALSGDLHLGLERGD